MDRLQDMCSLLGVLSQEESWQHLEQIAGSGVYSREEANDIWERSRSAYGPVHRSPGVPQQQQLPEDVWDYLLVVPQHPSFDLLRAGLAWSIRLVEIDALLSVALDLVISRLDEWTTRLSGLGLVEIVRSCLPQATFQQTMNVQPNRVSVLHDDLGATWTLLAGGARVAILAPPLPVRIVEISGFLYLLDGYHRAIALRRLGYTHIPAMILHDGGWGLLRNSPRPRRFEPPPFSRPNPPCLGHFTTPACVPTRGMRQVRIMTMQVDSFIAPVI